MEINCEKIKVELQLISEGSRLVVHFKEKGRICALVLKPNNDQLDRLEEFLETPGIKKFYAQPS